MEHTGHDRFFIQLQLCQNNADTHRVNDIWLSWLSELPIMRFVSNPVCLFDHRDIIGWMILSDHFDQLFIQHLRLCKIFRYHTCGKLSIVNFDFRSVFIHIKSLHSASESVSFLIVSSILFYFWRITAQYMSMPISSAPPLFLYSIAYCFL